MKNMGTPHMIILKKDSTLRTVRLSFVVHVTFDWC